MTFTHRYNKFLNEFEIYKDGEIFCHLSESDFEVFKEKFSAALAEHPCTCIPDELNKQGCTCSDKYTPTITRENNMKLSDKAQKALDSAVETGADALAEAINGSSKLVKENISELAREVIVYKGYIDHGISFVIGSGMLFGAYCCISTAIANSDRDYKLLFIPGLLLVGFGGLIAISSFTELLKARFAPRLFLIEYASSLRKKG